VVVLTHNRADEVEGTVEALLALPEQPQVIVVDNGSSDGTSARLRQRFGEIDLIVSPFNLGAAGRNLGVAHVTTDYVAFCDDDTSWEAGSLSRAVQWLDAFPRIGVLSARVAVGPTCEPDETCLSMKLSPLPRVDLPGPSLVGYMAGASIFRTALFRAVGGYEPRLFIGGEEELVALDVLSNGYAIVYADELVLRHEPSSVRDGALRRRMLARNAAWVAWLRLPLTEALRITLRSLAQLRREGFFFRDAGTLLRALPWALKRRRVVSAAIQAMRTRVREHERKHARRRGTARSVAASKG
jgi:GT2 family glycosyltransferase